MIYRLYPMIWYNCRLQQHQTVYGITPEPAANTYLGSNYRCDSADSKDPLYTDSRHYYQILTNQHPVTWTTLLDWLNTAMAEGVTLQGTKMPKPNQTFYIVAN
jgi:hypothetical protein